MKRNADRWWAVLALSAGLALSVPAVAQQHPSAACSPMPLSQDKLSTGRPEETWRDDLTFCPCAKRANELSPAERYIIAGLQPSPAANGNHEPWREKILMFALSRASFTGGLPAGVSDDELLALGLPRGEQFAARAAWYRSPITNEYPRFDSAEFSPGGVYLRLLTEDEKREQAQWNKLLAGLVTTGKTLGPEPGTAVEGFLLQPVVYYRFYGETGLLQEGIFFAFSRPGSS